MSVQLLSRVRLFVPLPSPEIRGTIRSLPIDAVGIKATAYVLGKTATATTTTTTTTQTLHSSL